MLYLKHFSSDIKLQQILFLKINEMLSTYFSVFGREMIVYIYILKMDD